MLLLLLFCSKISVLPQVYIQLIKIAKSYNVSHKHNINERVCVQLFNFLCRDI